MSFLSILVDHPGELLFRHASQPLTQGHARVTIHPHVERTVEAQRESSFWSVDLHGADADVEENTVAGREAFFREHLGHVAVQSGVE